MAKETYYFSHDCNARNDEKLIAVRMKHGAEGYGVFFMILERLMESTGYMSVKDYNIIAFDLRVSAEIVKSIICDFGLFSFTEDNKFYSESLNRRLTKLANSREQRRKAGIKSGESRRKKNEKGTTVEQPSNEKGTTVEQSKVKESKEKKRILPLIIPPGEKCERLEKVLSPSQIKELLLSDETWRSEAVRQSGLGIRFDGMIPELLDQFFSHIISTGEESTILFLKDAKRRFHYWWRDHGSKNKKPVDNGNNSGANIEFDIKTY